MPPRKKRKKSAEPASRGLAATQLGSGEAPAEVAKLAREIESDGGAVLGVFRDPLGGRWQVLAGLPIEKVSPTPFQRDVSPAHVTRLAAVIDRLDRFLDPIIAVRTPEGTYWTPNGNHRLSALRALGGRSVTALVLPDLAVAYKILALNTEKAHNLREKSLEVVRMAREIAARDPRPERDFALEFEEPSFLTLGLAYEERGRFAGGAYHSVLRRVERFLEAALPRALEERAARAAQLLALDDAVSAAVAALKERGFTSPYLKAFVVARLNPLRFRRGATMPADAAIEAMTTAAVRFDPDKVKAGDLATAAAGPAEE